MSHNSNIHAKLKRMVVLLMAFVIVFTYMPSEAFAANTNAWREGSAAYFKNGSTLVGGDGKKYESTYSSSYRHSYVLAPVGGGTNVRAYCLQRMIMNPSSGNVKYKATTWSAADKISSYSQGKQEGIMLALLYGAQPDLSVSDMKKLFGSAANGANKDDWWIATQMIIWDFEQGHRSSPSSIPKNVGPKNVGTKASGSEPANINYNAIKGRPAEALYFAMLEKIRQHKLIPSFTGNSVKKAKTIYMDQVDGVWRAVNPKYAGTMTEEDREAARQNSDYYVLEEKNGVDDKLKAVNTEGKTLTWQKWTKVKGGYTLTVEKEALPDKTQHGKKNIPETTNDELLVWQAPGYQTVATGADDPVDFYYKFKPVGTTTTPPDDDNRKPDRPDIEVFPEFRFPVEKQDLHEGWDDTADVHTGMGDAALDSTFELYRDGELVDSVTLDIFGTGDYLTDTPWVDPDDIPVVESGSYTHTTDDGIHCTVTPTDATWDAEVTYEIKEIVPDGRHAETKKHDLNEGVNSGEDPSTDGTRKTYTVTYHAETHNSQTCTSQTGAWSPIEYKITVTDATGTVTVYEGTVEDGTIEVDFVHEFENQVFINDEYRGTLQVVKTKDDLDPFTNKTNNDNGVKDYSTKSYWTIELASGGWEDCPYVRVVKEDSSNDPSYDKHANVYRATRDNSGTPADPDHPIEVSQYGQFYIYDLPYGTYVVKEIQADSNGYVLEEFEITISEDGQTISKEINNQAKRNVIKVVKTNSETGKTVRWDADRTAFRIKYIGNPDLADPASATNAGRYLPNGSSYTDDRAYVFYANENGEIVLPYEIEYGTYEIEELVVPEGYYVGQYDEKGTGTIANMGEVNIIDHAGQTVTAPKTFLETVQVRDKDGSKVQAFTGDNKTTYNTYRFSVLEQDAHMDGTDYTTYYAILDMPNNPAKGKIEITKSGEGLAGWSIGDIWKAVWDKITLKDTKYEIYAAEDILQSDGVIPIKAYLAADDTEVELEEVSRDHSDVDGAKEVWQKILNPEVQITKTSAKDKSDANMTITEYLVKALNGATYTDSFTVRDEAAKMTYKYEVEYKLNYSKGGFNYTDVHVTKKSIADDYVASIETTLPVVKSGDLEVGLTTMNYDGGNIVRMNLLDEEIAAGVAKDDATGAHSAYNTDDITATPSKPVDPEPVMIQNPDNPDDPTDLIQKTDENGDPVYTVPQEVVRPAGWTDVVDDNGKKTYEVRTDEDGKELPRYYMVTKDGAYQILVKDGDKERWIPCDEDGNYYLSYTQEYDLTLAQHYSCDDGFTFTWDDCVSMTAAADHKADTATTTIKNHEGTTAKITESSVYTHEVKDGSTVFTGTPKDAAPVYFKTNDGIKTEMYLSGKLTHTRVTVTQSQLFKFDHVLPMVTYDGSEINWTENFMPLKSDTYEKIFDENNYVKAERHEVSKDNKEVYFTIDIVSNNTDPSKGFTITYPDTTTAVPVVTDGGESAKLTFTSCDDTMVYPIGSAIETITSNAKGIAESSPLPLGEYWVREVSSTNGQVNAGEWHKFVLEYEDQYTPLIWDTASYENDAVSVKIDLEKLFETAYESKKYEAGSGAVFGIYTAEEIKGTTDTEKKVDKKTIPADTLVGKMVVENGHATSTIKLPLGKYYIKEISAPSGYKLNGTKYYFNAVDILTADQMSWHYKDIGVYGGITQNGENGVVVDFDTLYRYTEAKVTIDSKDYKLNESYTEEGSNVVSTVYDGRTNIQIKLSDGQSTTIKFENGATLTVKAEGQTYTATLDGKAPTELQTGADGNENFTRTTDGTKTVIKYSPKVTKTNWLSEVTYKYQSPEEAAAGDGGFTTIQPANKVLALTSPEGTSEVTASIDYAYAAAELHWYKGSVTGVTVDDEAASDYADGITLQRIVQTPVMDQETGEQKVDKDGNLVYKTEVKSSTAVINFADGATFTVTLDKSGQFNMSASGEVDKNLDTESVLTVDGTTVTALNLPLMKLVDLKNTTAKTYARNNTSAGVLNITVNKVKNDRLPDTPGTPTTPSTPSTPSIRTTAKDSETGDHISYADDNVTIIDTVSYYNLTPGQEYTLKGALMDKETGKAITAEGKELTATKVFTPATASGTVDMEFIFDGSALAGTSTVVFEELYKNIDTDKDGKPDTPEDKPTAEHKDAADEGQTVYFPEIRTNATDSETGDHIANADSKVTITDKVSYTNLIPGKEYTVSGTLMDQSAGKALLVDGKKVTATKTFVPDSADGCVELNFELDASALAGKTTVVFETLKYDGKTVAVHKDIKDKDQTVRFPQIRTSAAKTGKGEITDIVTFKNLIPGRKYTVFGTLMDKETGKAVVVDGKILTASTTFTPEESNGKVEVTFTFASGSLADKTVVVFETLMLNGQIVGEHKDINDKDQTVKAVGTVELDYPNGSGSGNNGDVSLIPKTGDNSNMMLYIGLMLAALALISVLVAYRRRQRPHKE